MSSLMEAYNKIVDWNASFIGQEYQPIDVEIMKPIFDLLPNDEDGTVLDEGHWLEAYLNFCPECGSFKTRGTDNMATYPEAYYKTFCGDCGFLVSMVDNSPCAVWYQYKSNDFKVEI